MAAPSSPQRALWPDFLDILHPRLATAITGALAALFIAGHVPAVRETLDGIDSTNFVLAIDGYDPRAHQPHPPGFPVHVAIARLVTSAYRAVVPPGEQEIATAATSLRIWSALSGSLTVVAMMWVALGVGMTRSGALLTTVLVTLCPLFWITAMRPLSDVPGLLFAMLSQALALSAYSWPRPVQPLAPVGLSPAALAALDYRWLGAAFAAGIAMGVRVQTTLLTLPILTVLSLLHARRAGMQILPPLVAAFLLGIALWAIPLVLTLGGPAEYFRLLTTVAADDVQGVEMIATHYSPRLAALALARTFLMPWGSALLGSVVVIAAIAGAVALLRSNRRIVWFAVVMGGPYLLFHLLFQETASIRYALPLVPVIAMLVAGASGLGRRWLWLPTAVVLMTSSAATSVKAAAAYTRAESPIARAFQDASDEAARRNTAPTLAFHHSVSRAIRAASWPATTLAAPVRYEWLEVARYWLDGHREDVWFLADARRTDLELIDSNARRWMKSYQWPAETEALLGGIQPPRVTWYEIAPPGWFLMRGWALTPEAAGVSTRDRHQPGTDGAQGYIRRRSGPALMLIGGRNLGGPCDTAARVDVLIDGAPRASWTVQSRDPFLQRIPLASGTLAGAGNYAEVRVVARDVARGGRIVDVAIEQFDVQSPGVAMIGLDRGWHMPELDATSGLTWRWTEDVAEVRVESFGQDVQLSVRGESPLRYFQESPHVVVRAGDAVVASFRPTEDFNWTVPLPAELLASARGRITIETDRSFVPNLSSGNGDMRRLALKVFAISAELRTKSSATR